MFEDTEKKLRELGKDDIGEDDTVTTNTREEPSTASLQSNTVPDAEFLQSLKKRVDDFGIAEVLKKDDGSLYVHPVTAIDNLLLYSFIANAVLVVLLVSKVIGVW